MRWSRKIEQINCVDKTISVSCIENEEEQESIDTMEVTPAFYKTPVKAPLKVNSQGFRNHSSRNSHMQSERSNGQDCKGKGQIGCYACGESHFLRDCPHKEVYLRAKKYFTRGQKKQYRGGYANHGNRQNNRLMGL